MNNKQFINIGFGSVVMVDKVISIVNPESAPIKRMIQSAREQDKLIDATFGRKTRAVIIMTTGHIMLSGIQVETIVSRLENNDEKR
ncbi:MAG: hypothetical protein CVU84_04425 [Firmicutes bacterium HGW-Firmicutes-1]|jgi:hypothetical protein|nr:MAG: hypothetical protein CVU84_04425 [Firmicutes bacterium HGW-Firmicutes-1]